MNKLLADYFKDISKVTGQKMKVLQPLSDNRMKELNSLLLDNEGLIKAVSPSILKSITSQDLAIWCHSHSIYGIPTPELIDWLKEEIRDKSAIEIGAGKGTFGKILGVPQTDGFIQLIPEVRLHYELMKQPIIEPHKNVQKFEASDAVKHFKPEVVFGSWITQHDYKPIPQSSFWGVKEDEILKLVSKYIVIGNEGSHGLKKILSYPHKKYKFDWLYSRSQTKSENIIYVWEQNIEKLGNK